VITAASWRTLREQLEPSSPVCPGLEPEIEPGEAGKSKTTSRSDVSHGQVPRTTAIVR
jgi:hypothetical protein